MPVIYTLGFYAAISSASRFTALFSNPARTRKRSFFTQRLCLVSLHFLAEAAKTDFIGVPVASLRF